MKLEELKGLYIAHRGIQTSNTMENTMPAFALALDIKVPIELDLHILRDGNIVVYHDDNLKRLMGIDKNIYDYTYDELRQLTFPNTNIHIPLFQEVLDFVRGNVKLVIEVKTNGSSYRQYCRRIVSILEKYPYDFVIQSFDIRIVKWFLYHTNYITGLLIIRRKKSFYDWMMRRKTIISILNPDFIAVDYHIVSKKVIQEFRKKKPVLVWTIRDTKILNEVTEFADSYLIEKFYF